jgi:hypothetical protein
MLPLPRVAIIAITIASHRHRRRQNNESRPSHIHRLRHHQPSAVVVV